MHNVIEEKIKLEWEEHNPKLSDHKGIVITIKDVDI